VEELGMTCLECRDLMLEVARRRAAPFVDRSVQAHVAECAGCRARLEHERALSAALGQMAREADGACASAEVEHRLMAAFAAQSASSGATTRSSQRVVARALPAAAALLLAAGTAAWWGLRPAGMAPQALPVAQVAPAGSPLLQPPTPQPVAVAVSHGLTPVHPGTAPPRRPLAPAVRPRPPVEAVGFVPIPSAAGLPAFESGEIVRLGISVTALPGYGVEIPAGAEQSVQADLLIGQDGQARAIRLVTTNADAPRLRQ
ncbi:MAG: hypothetical protein ABI211_12155, partial [Vicinamibacterales bacterium]